jgi:hypothetical protein
MADKSEDAYYPDIDRQSRFDANDPERTCSLLKTISLPSICTTHTVADAGARNSNDR